MKSKPRITLRRIGTTGGFFFMGTLLLFSQQIYVDPLKGSDLNPGLSPEKPVQTIFRAQQLVSELDTASDSVNVFLRGGVYYQEKPLYFTNKHGSRRDKKVVYSAFKNEKVVISGGKSVGDWKLHDRQKKIFKAKLPAEIRTRQLFVDGIRAIRARSRGDEKRWIVADSVGHFTSDRSCLTWKNPENIECVYREIWTNPRCGIASIQQVGDTLVRIKMKQPGWGNCRNKGITSTRTPWYFENAYELLDEPGEWYLDYTGAVSGEPNTLYYITRPGEEIRKSNFIIPVAEQLVVIAGENCDDPVRNIEFRGITFEYTTWLRPDSDKGHPDAQNNVLRENYTGEGESMAEGAALSMKYARHITIDECSFLHLGCAGINMHAGCAFNEIRNSLFYDLSGTGVQLGNYKNWKSKESEDSYDPENKNNILSNNVLRNNYIELCGVEFRSATGIAAAFPVDNVFENNTLRNLPYSGFHIGWGWTVFPYTIITNNRINANFIQNAMLELADGGAIYTLGGSLNSGINHIRDNYMNRVMWGQAMYLDNGSAFYDVSDNVCDRIDDFNVKVNSGSHNIKVSRTYSNKEKEMEGTGCYHNFIESCRLFTSINADTVRSVKEKAGTKRFHKTVWQMIPDMKYYEAELAEVDGKAYATSGIGTRVFGYQGMGFISGFNQPGEKKVSFPVSVSAAGKYKLDIRYSSGKGWSDLVKVQVNGRKTASLKLNPGTQNEWNTVTLSVSLKQGENLLSLITDQTVDAHLFIDAISILKTK